jgi:hypothetical protein
MRKDTLNLTGGSAPTVLPPEWQQNKVSGLGKRAGSSLVRVGRATNGLAPDRSSAVDAHICIVPGKIAWYNCRKFTLADRTAVGRLELPWLGTTSFTVPVLPGQLSPRRVA